jgi:hypothetical protein
VISDYPDVSAEPSGTVGFLLRLYIHNPMGEAVLADWSILLPSGIIECAHKRKILTGSNSVASGQRVEAGAWPITVSSPRIFEHREVRIRASLRLESNRFVHEEVWITLERLVEGRP